MIGVFIAWSDRSNSPGYVIDGNGCHIWVGATSSDGYGHVRVDGVLLQVHRVRYEREVGPIPEGLVLDHYVCNNGPRGCCNPLHCRPVTHRENILRGDGYTTGCTAGNAAKTHCPEGHPLEGDNLVASQLKRGFRACRLCQNAFMRQWKARKKAKSGSSGRGIVQVSSLLFA